MQTDQIRARVLNALKPAAFASSGVFDCPLWGGHQDLWVTIHASDKPNYLFDLGCFCGCDAQKVADEMMRLAAPKRRRGRTAR
jgi:hypothetical protein